MHGLAFGLLRSRNTDEGTNDHPYLASYHVTSAYLVSATRLQQVNYGPLEPISSDEASAAATRTANPSLRSK